VATRAPQVSSVELERVVLERLGEQLLDAAAVGVPTPGGGPELLHLFVVPREAGRDAALLAACQAAIRVHLNPLFKVERLVVVAALPRTASNKVMRRVLRDQLAVAPRSKM
jgi:acetyl-CoA synthetase